MGPHGPASPSGRRACPRRASSPYWRCMDAGRALIREPEVDSPRHYRRRVFRLALIYLALFTLSLGGIGLLLFFGRFFVGLSQRSNVETLVIAFFLVLFGYLGLLTFRGAKGGLRILGYRLRARSSRDPDEVERRKVAALGSTRKGPAVALNRLLERSDRPAQAFELAVRDRAGSVGRIRVDGVTLQHLEAYGSGSNDLLAFFTRQVCDVLKVDPDDLDVVVWGTIDEEAWHQYVGLAESMRALGRRTGDGTPIWPTMVLSTEHCAELERRLGEVCPAVREEAFLPQLEYEGEHKIPIIPEPLGILSLGRSERRVDPIASMGSALAVVALVVGLLVFFIVRPPWVPGI